MSNCIITIGRQYGAGGREIAEKLAKQLQIPLYDRKLVAFFTSFKMKLAQRPTKIPEFFSASALIAFDCGVNK